MELQGAGEPSAGAGGQGTRVQGPGLDQTQSEEILGAAPEGSPDPDPPPGSSTEPQVR